MPLKLGAWHPNRSRSFSTSARARSRYSNPGKVYFPEAGITKLELVALLPRGCRGRATRRGRPSERAGALRERHPRRVLLPEARARIAARLDRGRRAQLSLGPHRGGGRAARTRRRSPGWRTSAASSCTRTRCAPTTSTIPTSCASTSTRCRASSGRSSATWRASCARCSPTMASSAGRRPRARAGIHVHRAHPSALVVRGGAARRAGARARGGAARAGDRHQQVVEGGAPRRVPRLQPERQGPHRLQRLLGAAEAGRARVGAGHLGRAGRVRPGRLHAAHHARALRRRSATATPAIDEHPCSLRVAARAVGAAGSGGPRRRAVAAALREAAKASRRASSRRSAGARGAVEQAARVSEEAAARDRQGRAQGRRARRPGALEGAPSARPRRTSKPADVLVDSMRGRSSTWTRVRVNLEHVPEALRPAQEAARSRLRPVEGRHYAAGRKIAASSAGGVTSSWS